MEITKLSTKGQIVIPESMRKNFEVGSAFRVIKKAEVYNYIISKKVISANSLLKTDDFEIHKLSIKNKPRNCVRSLEKIKNKIALATIGKDNLLLNYMMKL